MFISVGIVGGVGSGKSTLAKAAAAQLGWRVIDADVLGHEALRDPEIRNQVTRRFGPQILGESNEIDRRKLADEVFRNVQNEGLAETPLESLNKLVHPWITDHLRADILACQQAGNTGVLVDAPLLYEVGWDKLCDVVAFVHSPKDLRIDWVRRSRNWTAEELDRRESRQMSLDLKRSRSDFVVENSGDLANASTQLLDAIRKIMTAAP